MQKLLTFIILIIFSRNLSAQDYPYTEYSDYRYIRYDKNKIIFPGDSSDFEKFNKKLDNLILKGEGKINIIHFGGSHIQAGIYSGVTRKKLQNFYPGLNGGRGFIFPYGMSKTYTTKNYRIKWTGKWETCRNVEHKDCSLGMLGIAATTHDSTATISVTLNPKYQKYETDIIKIFHETGKNSYKIRLSADSSTYKVTEFPEKGYTLIKTEDFISEIKLKLQKTDTAQNKFTLYGIGLENSFAGIIYTDAGISGASIPSFLKCDLLEKQLSVVKPDLVIISLGTNDTYGKIFYPERYKRHYVDFLNKIKNAVPDAAIILTVPNDCYYRRRDPLPFTADAEKVIFELAKEYNCGIWDFYAVMGGYNSSYLWHKDKLMQNDLIHFTKKGYIIKGNLFFNALIKIYDNHLTENTLNF
ncbi:MAG: GDSL-type esterase/lipase family protein [Bacteroidales bacterium]|nr:GDSL-type esterase/lipase family protein [Bacteroidales bacterium]